MPNTTIQITDKVLTALISDQQQAQTFNGCVAPRGCGQTSVVMLTGNTGCNPASAVIAGERIFVHAGLVVRRSVGGVCLPTAVLNNHHTNAARPREGLIQVQEHLHYSKANNIKQASVQHKMDRIRNLGQGGTVPLACRARVSGGFSLAPVRRVGCCRAVLVG
jgi:hypothetical protein